MSLPNDTPQSRASSLLKVSGPTLDFSEVSLTLGRTTILYKVTFEVRPGSVHALVGPNGGGKSSLIKTLLGQMPHQGRLSLHWPGEPGIIGYVPQALEFDRGLPMTVDDFMAAMCQRRPAFLGLSKHYAAAIGEALERVGMQDKRKRRMGALSGGERQRVLLAQGLIPAPQLLVLDEPMSALDEAGYRCSSACSATGARRASPCCGSSTIWKPSGDWPITSPASIAGYCSMPRRNWH